jgi:hypothetical protein
MANKYYLLRGPNTTPEEKEFDNDDAAIAAAKKDPTIIRVQHKGNLGHIYEKAKEKAAEKAAK